jgi:hypothetical protein
MSSRKTSGVPEVLPASPSSLSSSSSSSSSSSVRIVRYSEKSIAALGDTKIHLKSLKEIGGGRWNANLTFEGKTEKGWIFSLTKKEELEKLLKVKVEETVSSSSTSGIDKPQVETEIDEVQIYENVKSGDFIVIGKTYKKKEALKALEGAKWISGWAFPKSSKLAVDAVLKAPAPIVTKKTKKRKIEEVDDDEEEDDEKNMDDDKEEEEDDDDDDDEDSDE